MKKLGLLFLFAAQFAVMVAFWLHYHVDHPMGNLLTGEAAGRLLAWGRLAGLLAAFAILLQVLLIGRIRWIEQVFGFDRLTRLHHLVGFCLVGLLAAHPLLLTAGHAAQADAKWAAQFLDFVRTWEDVLPAVIALALLAVATVCSAAVLWRRLRYEAWYFTHLTIYVALALAFGHQLAVGSDFTANRWFAGYWWALYLFTFGNLFAYRVARPLWFSSRHRFTVARLVPETAEVTSVFMDGRELAAFPVKAGQFMIVRFLAPGWWREAHPFSMSCRPDGRRLRLTIKRLGDFTRRIPDLQSGTRVIVDGPHGVFTARRCMTDRVLMIAGGIGITPIRALAEELVAVGRDVIVIYGNRRWNAVVFGKELEELAAASAGRFRVIHVMSHDPEWGGERGRIDRDRLARLVPDISSRDVFLCGPPSMMKSVRTALLALGVPRARIYDERFAL